MRIWFDQEQLPKRILLFAGEYPRPAKPGRAARAGVLSVTEAARALGVSRKTLSAILNGRVGISPEMAVRLSIAFDTSAESRLNQQTRYDRWKPERHRSELNVQKLSAA